MPTIKIVIKDGKVVAEGIGFKGRKCDVIQKLTRRIGNITKIQKHAEYYLEPQIKEDVAIVENKK